MAAHSLKSLARLSEQVAELTGALSAPRAAVLQSAIRRDSEQSEVSVEGLGEVFAEIVDEAERDQARTLVGELIEAQREMLPKVLRAALNNDERLLDITPDDLASLIPLWVAASKHGQHQEAEGFAALFRLLAQRPDLPERSRVTTELRRLFLGAEIDAALGALRGLLGHGRLRIDDQPFFSRLELVLATDRLGEADARAIGEWVKRDEEVWEHLVFGGAWRPLRHRRRAAHLLELVARPDVGLEGIQLEQAARLAETLLADVFPEVWRLAARAIAWLTPRTTLHILWEHCFTAEKPPEYAPRLAAGLGILYPQDEELATRCLDAVLAGSNSTAAPRPVAQHRRAFSTALATGFDELGRSAAGVADQVAQMLLRDGDPVALAALAESLVRARRRPGTANLDEETLRQLDRALGSPASLEPGEWERVLATRESLIVVRGGRGGTSLRLAARQLAQASLDGEPTGRLLSGLTDLMSRLHTRLDDLAAPLVGTSPGVLGGRLHELIDTTETLVDEELLTPLIELLPREVEADARAHRNRLKRMKRQLRTLLHNQASDPRSPIAWRARCLECAARAAAAVPDDPPGRPTNPRTVSFLHLEGFPEFLREWHASRDKRAAASLGLRQCLDALLGRGYPGGGDVLLALLLRAPSQEDLALLASQVHQPAARERLGEVLEILARAPGPDQQPEIRLRQLLVTVEGALGLVIDKGAFAGPHQREVLISVRRHLRTAAAHERAISFMSPVRRSFDEPSEPLIVALSRDLAGLRRIAQEAAEPARLVALRAGGGDDGGLALAAEQAVSRAGLEAASFEAQAVITAEAVGDAIRLGARADPEDRSTRVEALGTAADNLGQLADLVRVNLSSYFGELISILIETWAELVREHQVHALEGPAHPIAVDKFKIEHLLGEGGMAFTYAAHDPHLDRRVTLKLLKPEVNRQTVLRGKFSDEAKALAALPPHPHVVQVFELLDSPQGPCLVMEFVDGEPLADAIPPGGMPTGFGLDVSVASALGLLHVHDHNLVHLDVKAENIMVTRQRTPKIIDFGLAQRVSAAQASTIVFGTPTYMSPEQAMGKKCGPPSDVYSLGVTLYEIFTGEVPFDDADPRKTMMAHVRDLPSPISLLKPTLPESLVVLVTEMLEKSPERRPQMSEVASRLGRIRNSLQPQDSEPSSLGRREIAILCMAVAGLDPAEHHSETVLKVIENFLLASNEIIGGLGGRVDATVGERVFAVFGYPTGDAQAAFKAVRAATIIGQRLRRLGVVGVDVYAGVATGQALVGQVRGDPTDATVLGEPLWRAARLVDQADDDERIMVDEASYTLVRGLVDYGKRRNARGVGRAWPVFIDDAT